MQKHKQSLPVVLAIPTETSSARLDATWKCPTGQGKHATIMNPACDSSQIVFCDGGTATRYLLKRDQQPETSGLSTL